MPEMRQFPKASLMSRVVGWQSEQLRLAVAVDKSGIQVQGNG
jgi:hypothetical protein